MEKTKFLILINKFSAEDAEAFELFLKSPYFVKNERYHYYFKKIYGYAVKKNFSEISMVDLYNCIYPGMKYNAQTIKNRLSELFRLAENFLIQKELERNNLIKEKTLLEKYINDKSYDLFDKRSKKLEKIILSDITLTEELHLLSEISYLSAKRFAYDKGYGKYVKEYMRYCDQALCYFMIQISNMGMEFALQENINIKHKDNFAGMILSEIDLDELINKLTEMDTQYSKRTLIHVYMYRAFSDLSEPSGKYYYRSKKIFNEIYKTLSNDYISSAYSFYSYYCALKQNRNMMKFSHELFRLFNEKLDKGFYSDLTKNVFSANVFRDYVFIGLRLNKLKWTKDFVEKYSKMLPADTRESNVNLSLGKIAFHKKNYKESLRYLNKVSRKNSLDFVDTALHKLKIFFELEDYENSLLLADNLKHYTSKHQTIPAPSKKFITSFLKYFHLLVKYKSDPNKLASGNKSEFEMIMSRNTTSDPWIKEKITEIFD